MSKTLGFCLGSGGSRGVAHIGFLQAMDEAGIRPDYICGCSMGAIVGGAYAYGISPQTLYEEAKALKLTDLAFPDIKLIKNNGLCRTDKVKGVLNEFMAGVTFNDLKIPFTCVAADMMSAEEFVYKEGFVVDAMVASASIPVFFQPTLTAEGRYMVDGGILDRVPVQVLKEMGAQRVVAVDVLATIGACKDIPDNLLKLMLKLIDVMDIRRTAFLKSARRDIIDLWIEPDLKDMSGYSLKDISFAYDVGYAAGISYAPAIKALR